MFTKLIVFAKKQIVFFSGIVFGTVIASIVCALLASITNTELLEVAKVLSLLNCYEESISEK